MQGLLFWVPGHGKHQVGNEWDNEVAGAATDTFEVECESAVDFRQYALGRGKEMGKQVGTKTFLGREFCAENLIFIKF